MIYFQAKDHGDAADVMILHILIDIRSTLPTICDKKHTVSITEICLCVSVFSYILN